MPSKSSIQQVLRLSTILLFVHFLSACASIQVSDKNFLIPDSKSGFKATTTFDATALHTQLPLASLKTLSISSEDNAILQGIEIRQPNAKMNILYFGGNAFHIDSGTQHVAANIGQCPANISLFDYRGYGRSNGTPSIENIQADALAIYDEVRKKTSGKLIVHGMSLGSFIAAYVAQHRALDGLILEATATNVSDWAYANTPWYAKPFVSFDIDQALKPIDNIKAARSHQSPALVIVGDKDKTTPPNLGIKVYEAFPSPKKQLIVVKNAGHGGLLSRPETMPIYCQFLSQNP